MRVEAHILFPMARHRLRSSVALTTSFLVACSGPSSHLDSAVWGRAFAAQLEQPEQLAVEVALASATVVTLLSDHYLQDEATEHQTVTEGSTANGDATAAALGVLAAGFGATEWITGDGGRSCEVLLESALVTDGITELLKHTVRRQRPASDNRDSFPSGHTSFAFSMATFLQRRVADTTGGSLLSYLFYLPATYVGSNRSEADKHWPSDVLFGALLGTVITNVVYDAHYGGKENPGLFGVRDLELGLSIHEEGANLALVFRF